MTPIERDLIALRERTTDTQDKAALAKAVLAVRALDTIRNTDDGCRYCGICENASAPIDRPPCRYCHGSGDHWVFVGREVFE